MPKPIPVSPDSKIMSKFAVSRPDEKTPPPFWPNYMEFCAWVDRNCRNCKFNKQGSVGMDPSGPCPAPRLGLDAIIHLKPTPKIVISITCRPSNHVHTLSAPIAPYTCWSRIDKRGRPRKS